MKYVILITIFISSLLISCTNKFQKEDLRIKELRGNALGTKYSILYFPLAKNKPIKKSIDSIFKVVNKSMSTYLPTSDISNINKGDTTVVVDAMFKDVFNLSKEVNKATQGYFDPTVGILTNAWGFGPGKAQKLMNKQTIDSLMQYVGFSKITLTTKNTIKKTTPKVYLDFNAIAKGYSIDRIAVYLDTQKISNYLIEVGGELITKGIHLDKQKEWTVGIDDPNQQNTRKFITTLKLKNKAMATSGNYRKFRIDSITGNKYVHTINAFTGYTKLTNVLSVSVLANNCATADAYATAFMAMPLQKTINLLSNKQHQLEAYIVYSNKKGIIETYVTKGFKKILNQ